jgi:NAD(P)-dependent dehydrogenase (short-subunit alcohol dehydrogenase family)
MELRNSTVLILGGAGLVGRAVARRVLAQEPRRLVIASLRQEEAEDAIRVLQAETVAETQLEAAWGDLFVPDSLKEHTRSQLLSDPEARGLLISDMFGPLTEEVFQRSALGRLLMDVAPSAVVDCVNTAGALAYQDVFQSAAELRERAAAGTVDEEAVDRHLSTMYLPKLIRHTQIALAGMKRAGTQVYVKIGTSGTGGMGLNIPFTHSEVRPSRVLLAKAGLAGAQTLLLYLMARTPDAPAVKEIKPTAAISWKSIGFGPIYRGGRPALRSDATRALSIDEAFGPDAESAYEQLDAPLEGVYMDSGENGMFSLHEFETLTALGLMEFVTPEEIAENVFREIAAYPTGKDVVAAMDGASMGPTFRAGVLRSKALQRMEELEEEHGVQAPAYEMLGPPRLSKLLFEGMLLRRLYETLERAVDLDPDEAAEWTRRLVEDDGDLRQRILSIGLPVLMPDGENLLRGARVKVAPEAEADPFESGVVERGWVDLRPMNWARWRGRIDSFLDDRMNRPGVEAGSMGDHDYGNDDENIRPGALAAWILRSEERGQRIKR